MTTFAEWLRTIPAGIWGALAGAVTARLLTWLAERRRNRDAYRAPQRETIGAIIAAANDMKVSLSDALEHMGLTGRKTTDDAAVASLNTFLRRLLALDEQFSIGRLTVVDGPCRDKMMTAYVRFSELRKLANDPAVATPAGFGEFVRQMNDTSNALDTLLAELVDLAERRLSPARPLLSRRPKVKVASNKARSQPKKRRVSLRKPAEPTQLDAALPHADAPTPAAGAAPDAREGETPAQNAAELRDAERQPAPHTPQIDEREVEVVGEPDARARIRTELIKGEQLTLQHVGRLVTEGRDGYNIMGRILDLTPVITDTAGSWLVTVHWAALPGQRPRVDRRRIRFSDDVELVEIIEDDDTEPEAE
ncbi:hypothetical protein [Mycobacterium sp. 852002-10029_SCH5224772]|uniref:hypothetical protein n=1 Tax=Mycobacterium sp. 852002-10029_SCH5224772 TaxID=1834083 RepID=UPI0008015603|nr:hypothetical protein [Mycobacterium sp. 852002-10029_SCH5224772]OBF05339.1 hypothetical protein A5775_24305 [Mycobacterium sp. 852002-10029_SCH5224772]